LIRDPDNDENWVQRFSAGFSIRVGFGKSTETGKESYIQTLIEIMRGMQDEIDRVVGDDRMPTFDDIPDLPIVRAFYKETLRWRPVTAGGFPHRLMKDDVYEGYFIPEGVNVHGNIW
jgi:cytochrome P450